MTERLFTRNYILTCLSSLGHNTSFQLLLAALPLYVVAMGGRETAVGMLMAVAAGASLVTRPFAGWAVGALGRKATMASAPAAFAVASAAYAFAGSVPMLMAFRFLHGFGISTFSTAAPVLIGEQAPASRRGEAMGYFSISQTLAQAIGPGIGLFVAEAWGFTWLFGLSAGMALAALALGLSVTDPFAARLRLRPTWGMFVNRKVLRPFWLVLGIAFATGSILSFIPLYARQEGVNNPGLFFTLFAVVMMVSRPFAGRLSDRWGRIAVTVPGIVSMVLGLGLLVLSGQWWALYLSAVLLGIGLGTAYPALMALMLDMVTPEERGGAMSTFGIGMDVGIATGSVLQGIAAEAWGFEAAFGLAAAVPLLSLIAYQWPKTRPA